MSITIQAKESIQAPIQTIASIVVHSLLDELVDISRKINEGKSDSKDPWEESLLSTACEYTIEAIGERLQNCIGKEYLSISALNDDLYHALEPLKLVEATEPKTSRMVTWGIGRALRD